MRVGIIGLGHFGEIMMEQFHAHPHTKVTHLCDLDEDRVMELASKIGAKWHTNYLTLLQQADIDMVYISVPPKFHFAVVLAALEHQKHVLCEKPLANSVEEAFTLAQKAKQSGLIHAMHFPLQYSKAIPVWRELQQTGYIGKLRRIEVYLRFPQWPRPYQNVAWVGTREQGGVSLEVCVHLIQIIQHLYGPIRHVDTELEYPDNPDLCEQGVHARMELADGTPVYFNSMTQIAGEGETVELTAYGSKGTLSMAQWDHLIGGTLGEKLTDKNRQHTDSIIQHLYQAFHNQDAMLFDFENGYQAQIVMEALRGRNQLKHKGAESIG